MANEEHVKILKQGWEVWNAWRRKNRNVEVEISEAYLPGIDLRFVNLKRAKLNGVIMPQVSLEGANLDQADISNGILTGAKLSSANLNQANLEGANLFGANLYEARLINSNLSNADIREANLIKASFINTKFIDSRLNRTNFKEANLRNADFSGANLHQTNLSGAHLVGTSFYNALMGDTILANVNLSAVKGLEDIKHISGSTMGVRTLRISKGKIPEVFLRGIGWSDAEIQFFLPLYLDRVIEYYSGFISYSSKDEEFAQRLYNDLQGAGIRVWFAPEDLKGGDEFWKVINKEIRLRDKLILVLSENSVNSDWVAHEVEQAFEEEKARNEGLHPDEPIDPVLLPVAIDDAVFEVKQPWATKLRRDRNIRLMQEWKNHDEYQKGLEKLLHDLKGSKGN